MHEQKKIDGKGLIFRAGQCTALKSCRVGKMLFLLEKIVVVFIIIILQDVADERRYVF